MNKSVGYIRTPENLEIEFIPDSYSISRSVCEQDTIEISGKLVKVTDRKEEEKIIAKRMNNIMYGDNTYVDRFKSQPSNGLRGMRTARDILDELCGEVMNNTIKKEDEDKMGNCMINDVIFNPPATIVFWKDGTKTVVKCQDGDCFDPEKGIAMAYFKKLHGNKGSYNNIIKTWIGDYQMSQYKQDDEAYADIFNSLLSVITLGASKNNKGYTEKSFEAFENPVIREALINGVINFDMLKKISYEKSSDLSEVEVWYNDGTKAVFDFSNLKSDSK